LDFICRKVIDFIRRHSLVSPGETVVVGVSGGADSVCLLHVLAKWQKESGLKLHVAHLNHQLRGAESEADAEYVSGLARSLGIPVTIGRQDVAAYRRTRSISVEEAARELRHAFLAGVAGDVGAGRIALGHTRDDQVETILMHILRGTGTGGLCGLAACSPLALRVRTQSAIASPDLSGRSNLLVIRPLLDITREETTGYCREQRLDPRIDSSNLSLSFFRNRLRLELLPLLRQYNPAVDRALLRLADIAGEDSAFIEGQAALLWDEVIRQEDDAVHVDRKGAARLPVALQRQLLRAAVAKLAGDTRDIEAGHIEAARGLLRKPVGKRVSLPHGLVCRGEYDELVIFREPGVGAEQRLLRCARNDRKTGPGLAMTGENLVLLRADPAKGLPLPPASPGGRVFPQGARPDHPPRLEGENQHRSRARGALFS
jgi:tRNA(Ile)-lysidine synthase